MAALSKNNALQLLNENQSLPRHLSYSHVSAGLKNALITIDSTAESNARADLLDHAASLHLPPAIKVELLDVWYMQMIAETSTKPDSYYDVCNDAFLKDFAVASLRAFPVGGAWIIEESRIPKSFFLAQKHAKHMLRWFAFILIHPYALGSFYQIHTTDKYIFKFNSDNRITCYKNICSLLKQISKYKVCLREAGFMTHH